MTIVTSAEIENFRSELADYPDALAALDVIEDCEGDLEDAAMVLAIRVGQQPEIANAEWLPIVSKKCRAVICQEEFRDELVNGKFARMMGHLAATKLCPSPLVTPVLMYVAQQGVENFCQPLDPVS
ncbi:hypothetical protein [Coleofasciculus sp. FACHB-129]|uniref:hypothetical protein n=1 Tax=Cyanophyceae TaxID=3028117 RepID=UPI001683B00C|nr:hypothetical protein [Coleofasciculus sp. FACHB-129]MBD1894703.1 hypothetical protein [Coleofasciculus sp. FACHB-129]